METCELKNGSSQIISLAGRMTFNDHKLMKSLTRQVVSNGNRLVTFDLSKLMFVDSAGIGMLLIISEELRKIGGRIFLNQAQGQVKRVLMVANIYDIVDNGI